MVDEVEASSIWVVLNRVAVLINKKVSVGLCQGCMERKSVLIDTYIL